MPVYESTNTHTRFDTFFAQGKSYLSVLSGGAVADARATLAKKSTSSVSRSRPGQVTDSNRRAIKKALARVTRGSSSRSGRASSSRSRRHADKARGGQPSLSASLARSKPRVVATDNATAATAIAGANGTPPDKGENGHGPHQENGRTPPPRREPPTEEEEEAVVVDTTALRTPTKRPRSTDNGTAAAGGGRGWRSSNGGGWGGVVGFLAAAVDRSGGGDSRSRARPAKDNNRDGSNTVREAAAAATPAVEGGNDGPRVSPSSPAAFVVSPEKPLPAELDDLRRRVKDLTLSAATAETGDVEGRAALRRALEEADARGRDAVVAERAKSESLGALVQVRFFLFGLNTSLWKLVVFFGPAVTFEHARCSKPMRGGGGRYYS